MSAQMACESKNIMTDVQHDARALSPKLAQCAQARAYPAPQAQHEAIEAQGARARAFRCGGGRDVALPIMARTQ